MYNPMFDDIKMMAEADIKEIIGKGSIEPHEYPCIGEAIDIIKDIHKIKKMCLEEEKMMMGEEGGIPYEMSGRMPQMRMNWSNARGGSNARGQSSREGSYESYAQGGGSNGSYAQGGGSNAQGGSNESYAQGGGSNERGGSREGSYEQGGSQYNPNRSPLTGRYTSRDGASYHDMDGSMKKDLEELLGRAKDDHERMILMRVLSKIEQ